VFYARYLLTHLASPRDVLAACVSAGRRGSVLVLEENCALLSVDPLFDGYYRRLARMHAHPNWVGPFRGSTRVVIHHCEPSMRLSTIAVSKARGDESIAGGYSGILPYHGKLFTAAGT
jgi:hypothetical protein